MMSGISQVVAKDETYARSQVGSISVVCHVTIPKMVYHLRYASNVETYARCAATHCLSNGVGQIVLQTWCEESIDGVVDLWHQMLANGAETSDANAVGQRDLFSILAYNDQMKVSSFN